MLHELTETRSASTATKGNRVALVPPVTPCNGINVPIGGGHPDAALFSTYVMKTFGGDGAVRRDFGGFLMAWSAFLDEHLEEARTITFDDTEAERAYPEVVDWRSPHVSKLLRNLTLSSTKVAAMLDCSPTAVRSHRRAMGLRAPQVHGGGWHDTPERDAIFRDVTLTAPQVAQRLGVSIHTVANARTRAGISWARPRRTVPWRKIGYAG